MIPETEMDNVLKAEIEAEHLEFIESVLELLDSGWAHYHHANDHLHEIRSMCENHLAKHKQTQQPKETQMIEYRYFVTQTPPQSFGPHILHEGNVIEMAMRTAYVYRGNVVGIIQLWDARQSSQGEIDLDLYTINSNDDIVRTDKSCPDLFKIYAREMEKIIEAQQPECPSCQVVK